ncbi:MAG: hypothetical protein ACI4GY_10020 [Acutalibacteraceae bacterium]
MLIVIDCKNKKAPAFKAGAFFGGEHGIRTHETVLAVYTIVTDEAVDKTVFCIDDGNHFTFLLSEEY